MILKQLLAASCCLCSSVTLLFSLPDSHSGRTTLLLVNNRHAREGMLLCGIARAQVPVT